MLRRTVLIVLSALGIVVVAVGGFLLYVAATGIPHYVPEKVELTVLSTPARVLRGKKLASMLCAGCHLDQATGALSGKEMIDAPGTQSTGRCATMFVSSGAHKQRNRA